MTNIENNGNVDIVDKAYPGGNMESRTYLRKYLRIALEKPISGKLSIVQVFNRQIRTGSASVIIENISSGGLKFTSELRLPADKNVINEICFGIDESDYFCIRGYVVRALKSMGSRYEYGFQFLNPDLKLRNSLNILYMNMSIRNNRRIIILKPMS